MFVMLLGLFLAAVISSSFLLGLRSGIIAVILIRPLCDRLFELARFDVAGHAISYGVLVNIVVIFALLLNTGRIWHRAPSGLKTIWLPFLLMAFIAILYSPV